MILFRFQASSKFVVVNVKPAPKFKEGSADDLFEVQLKIDKLAAELEYATVVADAYALEQRLEGCLTLEADCKDATMHWKHRKRLCMEMLTTLSKASGVSIEMLMENFQVQPD